VTGHERRHELVAQLDLAQRAAVLVASGEQEREHVIPLHISLAAVFDELEDQPVGELLLSRAPARRSSPRHRRQRPQQFERSGAGPEQRRERVPDCIQLPALLQAEHDAQDDLERHPLQAWVERHRLTHRP